jgi:hypothetical protein
MGRLGVLACVFTLAGCDVVLGLEERRDGGAAEPLDATRPDGEPVGCPASYDRILQTTASRYRVVGSKTSWPAARALCASDKPGFTHLIVLSNEQEWRALLREPEVYLTEAEGTWVGFSDVRLEGDFLWVTNESTSYGSVGKVAPWDVDQPDDVDTGNPDDDCAAMRVTSGVLHDEKCDHDANYICECDGIADEPTH